MSLGAGQFSAALAPPLVHAGSRRLRRPFGETRINRRGFEHAKQLISEGRAVTDERFDWRDHRPDADKEDAYMSAMGAERYGDWHLGIDDQQPEGSKFRYHFLFGDFSDVHRCALFEIQVAADNLFYGDIEIAAAELISLLGAHAPANDA